MFLTNYPQFLQIVRVLGVTRPDSGDSNHLRVKKLIGYVLVVCIQTLRVSMIFQMAARLWLAISPVSLQSKLLAAITPMANTLS